MAKKEIDIEFPGDALGSNVHDTIANDFAIMEESRKNSKF